MKTWVYDWPPEYDDRNAFVVTAETAQEALTKAEDHYAGEEGVDVWDAYLVAKFEGDIAHLCLDAEVIV